MTMLSEIGEDARLLALLLEALECALKVLVVMDYDFRQILLPPFVAFAAPAIGYRKWKLVEGRNRSKLIGLRVVGQFDISPWIIADPGMRIFEG